MLFTHHKHNNCAHDSIAHAYKSSAHAQHTYSLFLSLSHTHTLMYTTIPYHSPSHIAYLPPNCVCNFYFKEQKQHAFQYGISFKNLLLDPRVLSTNSCQELQYQFCGFGFSGSTFPADDAALVSLSTLHEVVGVVSDGKDVRWSLADLLVLVAVDVSLIVDGQQLVWIDGHENGTSVCLYGVEKDATSR